MGVVAAVAFGLALGERGDGDDRRRIVVADGRRGDGRADGRAVGRGKLDGEYLVAFQGLVVGHVDGDRLEQFAGGEAQRAGRQSAEEVGGIGLAGGGGHRHLVLDGHRVLRRAAARHVEHERRRAARGIALGQ